MVQMLSSGSDFGVPSYVLTPALTSFDQHPQLTLHRWGTGDVEEEKLSIIYIVCQIIKAGENMHQKHHYRCKNTVVMV